jgi:hypothetical protein
MATSNVTLILDGLLILTATEGEDNGEVGILGLDPPGHALEITVTRKHGGTTVDVKTFHRNDLGRQLSLDIQPGKKISVRDKTPVNRMNPVVHEESVKWFVDLDELYGFAIGADRDMFSPILSFNGGELFTAVTPNDSILDRHPLLGASQHIGRVALYLGVFFKNSTRAIFRNEGVAIFDSNDNPGDDYEIHISHGTRQHSTSSADANWYYIGVGENIPLLEEIMFSSDSTLVQQLTEIEPDHAGMENHGSSAMPSDVVMEKVKAKIEKLRANGIPFAGPEAACFPAYLSQTKMT